MKQFSPDTVEFGKIVGYLSRIVGWKEKKKAKGKQLKGGNHNERETKKAKSMADKHKNSIPQYFVCSCMLTYVYLVLSHC